MLQSPTPFPNPGCTAFLKHTAQAVRVLQHKPHEQGGPAVLVSVPEQRCCAVDPLQGHQPATTKTVPLAEIFPDRETAMHGSIRAAHRAQRRRLAPAFPPSSPRT